LYEILATGIYSLKAVNNVSLDKPTRKRALIGDLNKE